ncbi:MAG: hypothetical protein AVDCRST_MAG86-2535, partial [uncultured Truepera sp.]
CATGCKQTAKRGGSCARRVRRSYGPRTPTPIATAAPGRPTSGT